MNPGYETLAAGGMQALVLFLMALGLIFTFIPILPGTVIIWGAALAYGQVVGWAKLGWLTLVLMTLLMLFGIVADALAGHFGAKMGGASWRAIISGAILGFILGTVFSLIATPITGCLAGLAGAVGGVLWVEWRRRGDWAHATRATKGYVVGSALGILAKMISGVLMVVVFLLRLYGWL